MRVQYMHIPNRDECNWLRERIELSSPYTYSRDRKKLMLDRLAWSDMFEIFLANKYAAAKRFGLEGAESLIPGMKALIDSAADQGVRNVVIGMPHRGRLNILGNVVRKPLRQIFSEFAGKAPEHSEDQYFGAPPLARLVALPTGLFAGCGVFWSEADGSERQRYQALATSSIISGPLSTGRQLLASTYICR